MRPTSLLIRLLATSALVLAPGLAFAAYDGSPPLIVANGGTGAITLTAHGPLVGAGTGAIVALTPVAGSVMYQSSAGADPAMSATPVLGVNASTTGSLGLANGGGSGATVTIKNPSSTSAWEFDLPTGAGGSGQILASAAGAGSAMTWDNISSHLTAGTGVSLSGTTNVTISSSGTPTLLNYTTSNATVTLGGTSGETVAFNQSGTKATTINLPTEVANLRKCIKDAGNDFNANSPTVKATGTIDSVAGATGKAMNQTKQELCFLSDGTNWVIE